jgi:HAD superfamily hydrolase (TIGR01549 family)
MPYKTIAFDCFGTLAYIGNPLNVFSKLARRSVSSRINPRLVMCAPWSLSQAATSLGVDLAACELAELEDLLAEEVASIQLFPETREVLAELKSRGFQIAVCSNLALPYAAPVQRLVGDLLDVEVWSFEAAALKPSFAMYGRLLESCGSTAAETLMVGDSLSADYEGAKAADIAALHLIRDSAPAHNEQISSLTGVLHRV